MFLHADNGDIFESLLWKAFDDAQENEFLVYSQVRSEYIYRSPYNWIAAHQTSSDFIYCSHQI